MEFMLIEYDLDGDGKPTTSYKFFIDYASLLETLKDEHYANGVCLRWSVLTSNEKGEFDNLKVFNLIKALL